MRLDAEELVSRCLHNRLDFLLREGNLPDHDLVDGALEWFAKHPVSANRDGTVGGHGCFCSVAFRPALRFMTFINASISARFLIFPTQIDFHRFRIPQSIGGGNMGPLIYRYGVPYPCDTMKIVIFLVTIKERWIHSLQTKCVIRLVCVRAIIDNSTSDYIITHLSFFFKTKISFFFKTKIFFSWGICICQSELFY